MFDYTDILNSKEYELKDAMMKCDVEAYRNTDNFYYLYIDLDGTIHSERDKTRCVTLPCDGGATYFLVHMFKHDNDIEEFINTYAFNDVDEVKQSIKFRFNIDINSKSHTKNYYKFIMSWLPKKGVSNEDIDSFFNDIKTERLNNFDTSIQLYDDIFKDCLSDATKCLSRAVFDRYGKFSKRKRPKRIRH